MYFRINIALLVISCYFYSNFHDFSTVFSPIPFPPVQHDLFVVVTHGTLPPSGHEDVVFYT